jgi:hypothetical protein
MPVQTQRHRERKETGMALVFESSTQIEGRGVGTGNKPKKTASK